MGQPSQRGGDPIERFLSAYRYAYADIGQPGKPAGQELGKRFPTVDSFIDAVADSPENQRKYMIGAPFERMSNFVTPFDVKRVSGAKGLRGLGRPSGASAVGSLGVRDVLIA